MKTGQTKRPFTGRHMAMILVIGFGIVAAVNFYMASLATGGFHGVVVKNSYVASQNFNVWLKEAEAAEKLGWKAQPRRSDDGYVLIDTAGLPQRAAITAQLRRPIGTREYAELDFAPLGDGVYRSTVPIAGGRWTMRLFIEGSGHKWADESELK